MRSLPEVVRLHLTAERVTLKSDDGGRPCVVVAFLLVGVLLGAVFSTDADVKLLPKLDETHGLAEAPSPCTLWSDASVPQLLGHALPFPILRSRSAFQGPCAAGFFVNNETGHCTACQANTSQPAWAHTEPSCAACPAGTFAREGSATCQPLFQGAPPLANATLACGNGTFPGNGTCLECPAGSFSSNDSAAGCLPCPPGTFSGKRSDTCVSVPTCRNKFGSFTVSLFFCVVTYAALRCMAYTGCLGSSSTLRLCDRLSSIWSRATKHEVPPVQFPSAVAVLIEVARAAGHTIGSVRRSINPRQETGQSISVYIHNRVGIDGIVMGEAVRGSFDAGVAHGMAVSLFLPDVPLPDDLGQPDYSWESVAPFLVPFVVISIVVPSLDFFASRSSTFRHWPRWLCSWGTGRVVVGCVAWYLSLAGAAVALVWLRTSVNGLYFIGPAVVWSAAVIVPPFLLTAVSLLRVIVGRALGARVDWKPGDDFTHFKFLWLGVRQLLLDVASASQHFIVAIFTLLCCVTKFALDSARAAQWTVAHVFAFLGVCGTVDFLIFPPSVALWLFTPFSMVLIVVSCYVARPPAAASCPPAEHGH